MQSLPQNLHVEVLLQVSQILPYHLLAQPFAGNQKSGHGTRPIVEKMSFNKVINPLLRFSANILF